jgi:2-keto-4-pentenoate hydratase/2-oxohepta-3-ene-1,7-dioic acid hydratase in catechol pathway
MEFRLLSYVKESAAPQAGLLVEDQTVLDVESVLKALGAEVDGLCPTSVLSILENWDKVSPRLGEGARRIKEAGSVFAQPLAGVRLAAPILYPPNIYCAAANYVDHHKEMKGGSLPEKSLGQPYFFTKLTRQTVIGPDEPIKIPSPEARIDWEAEIGVVIGRRCRRVSASDAMEYVAGYLILNDLSDRARNFRKDWFFKYDWLGGKSFDTSAPMGPWITPKELIRDPHDLSIRLWVGDDLMQDASSRDMYFTIPEQIEYLSTLFTLLPGDVIGTGTPQGVGHARGVYLKPGDAVSITIEGLGSIRNPVVAGF